MKVILNYVCVANAEAGAQPDHGLSGDVSVSVCLAAVVRLGFQLVGVPVPLGRTWLAASSKISSINFSMCVNASSSNYMSWDISWLVAISLSLLAGLLWRVGEGLKCSVSPDSSS